MGFKTSTSRCPRKARTEEERAADASNGLRVRIRPFTNSTADPRTHTHARARARCDGRGEMERETEKKKDRVRSIAEKGRSRARALARETERGREREREREMQRSEGGERGDGEGLERKKQVRRMSRDGYKDRDRGCSDNIVDPRDTYRGVSIDV